MSQKSVADFFKPKNTSTSNKDKKNIPEEKVPKQASNKKRGNRIIDSDEEEQDKKQSKTEQKIQKKENLITEEVKQKLEIKEDSNNESNKIENNQKNNIEKEEKIEEEKEIKQEKKSVQNTPKKNVLPTVEKKQQLSGKKEQEVRKDLKGLKFAYEDGYDLIKDAPFNKDQNVPFLFVAQILENLQEIKGQNSKSKKVEILSRMFKSIILLKPDQLIKTYYFCILKIAPDYELNELGIGDSLIKKVLQSATGKSAKQIRDDQQKYGDLGLVALHSKATQKNIQSFFSKKADKPPLIMSQVYDELYNIAHTKGNNSNTIKEGMIIKLLQDSSAVENKFIVRYIEKNLRIGCAEKTMQDGLTKAFFDIAYFGKKNTVSYSESQQVQFEKYSQSIKRALCEYPNYTEVIETLAKIDKDIDQLQVLCKATPGVPCKPMLAKPTKSIQVILTRFENQKFTCEYKYDGLRGQIHYKDNKVTIFSRNLENMTETYPDIVKLVEEQVGEQHDSFIMDSEIVAFDTKTNRIKSFQELSNRARKNVSLEEINVKVCIFMFDLIYINGVSLLQTSLQERRNKIKENFQSIEGKFQMATHLDTDDVDEIQEFLEQSVKDGCEGLMVKTLEENGSSYEPAKRSFKWLKLKKDYIDNGLGDSLDLVPIGAMFGGGKRKGLYGAYLLACYNDDMECYETICKTGTGFSDSQLEEFHNFFKDKITTQIPNNYRVKDFKADVWFNPSVVWEIKGADLQISPVYTCAVGTADESRGIGLRFPRLIRIRDDKKPEEATTGEQIYDIYKQQSTVDNLQDDDDFY